jgi:quercetin dioxygenase-like cupin family protein
MTWDALPERTLEPHELRALVETLSSQPERWAGQVAFSDSERHYVSLHRDDYVDIWLLCWTTQNDTGWHDHDVSSGAVSVVRGTIQECIPRIGGEHRVTAIPAGQSFHFGPEHIHRLQGVDAETVTIHAYSPPLCRLGQYVFDEDGLMRRVSVSYAEELRVLDQVA